MSTNARVGLRTQSPASLSDPPPMSGRPTAGASRLVQASDEDGSDLVITIRLAPDGRVYFHDITADILPVAHALAPTDATLASRRAALDAFGTIGTQPTPSRSPTP